MLGDRILVEQVGKVWIVVFQSILSAVVKVDDEMCCPEGVLSHEDEELERTSGR